MPSTHSTSIAESLKAHHAAHFLNPSTRQGIAIQTLAGHTPISHIAEQYSVSRKFVYQQKEKGLEGLSEAFDSSEDDDEVLFYQPVTKRWLAQLVLALIFIGRCSYRGVVELFRDLLDTPISKATVHNIVYEHLEMAKSINHNQDLSAVQTGLHDEIYQAGDPVLVDCCARSTYCYLLSLEESCDANSWGVHLLGLLDNYQLVTADFWLAGISVS